MDAVALALPVLIALITVALAFDFLNGLHDAANSIATIVSTRVLRPQHAVIWAAFFNFVAFLIFGAHVAETVGTGIVAADIVDPRVVFAALTGAMAWNIITWALGIPSSSSHALIGGLVGAGVAKAGINVIVWGGLGKTTAAIVLSPLTGFFLALLIFLITSWVFVRYTPFAVDRLFRSLQLVSASLYSIGHGGNDAQKTMGIITVLLYSQGYLDGEFHVPFWVMLACYAAMGLGTLLGGGSCGPWARASRGLRPSRAFAPRPAAPSPCSRRPSSAFQSRPRIPSPAASSASAPRAGCRRCAGRWRTIS
jgi:PiT family inorganic phosphate transporter